VSRRGRGLRGDGSIRVAAALVLAMLASPAYALTHFYCYAADAASGTVYVSSVLPVGPVAERSRYGVEFVEHLKKTGRVKSDVAAYCVMRDGAEAIASSRAALPYDCRECQDLSRFADVAWARGGVTLPTAPIVPKVRSELHAEAEPAKEPPPAPETAAATTPVDTGPWVVVLGNVETGKLLVVSQQPNLKAVARAQARTVRPTGWTDLLATREPGYGAAFCVRVNDETRFFVAHGQPSIRDAIREARQQAESYAKAVDAKVQICGAPWQSSAPVERPERDEGVIDAIRGTIREWVTCDPKEVLPDGTRRKCPVQQPSPGGSGVRG
jgi:hypothetical protein